MTSKIAVVGSGFSGLAAACVLAHAGYAVTVYEKNATPGGRARRFTAGDFVFDMGPSWYWMPDVFERFFSAFGKMCSDYYDLIRLDPSYRIYFGKGDLIDVPAHTGRLYALFEHLEPGSSQRLGRFIAEAKTKYELSMRKLVYHPGIQVAELMQKDVLRTFPGSISSNPFHGTSGDSSGSQGSSRSWNFPFFSLAAPLRERLLSTAS